MSTCRITVRSPDFPDDLVVETVGYVDRNGVTPLAMGHCRAMWSGW